MQHKSPCAYTKALMAVIAILVTLGIASAAIATRANDKAAAAQQKVVGVERDMEWVVKALQRIEDKLDKKP